jgi:hypothetical protein
VLPREQELVEVNHLEVRVCEGGFSEEGEWAHREGSSLHLRKHQQMCQLVLVAGSVVDCTIATWFSRRHLSSTSGIYYIYALYLWQCEC